MKKLLLAIFCSIGVIGATAQDTTSSPADTINKAKIYVIRSTGHVGSAVNFRVVVDSTLYCKMKNNRHAVIWVEPGTHDFFATTWDAPRTREKLALKIPVEAGKVYYLSMRVKQRFFEAEIFMEEVTANTALPLLGKYERVSSCE